MTSRKTATIRSGDEADAAELHRELCRTVAAFASGSVHVNDDPDGQNDHCDVEVREDEDVPDAAWWRITLWQDRTIIQRGDRNGPCHVQMEMLHGTFGNLSDEVESIASALLHAETARDLVSPEAPKAEGAMEAIEAIAHALGVHVHAKHGPTERVHALVIAGGPIGTPRGAGTGVMASHRPGRKSPGTTDAFSDMMDREIGPVVRVTIEDAGTAVIERAMTELVVLSDPLQILRECSDGGDRDGWTPDP